MTIKQYAAKAGVSPQAVYQRLKKNKIRVESLTEKGSGELSGEGIVILDKLFDPENRPTKPPKDEMIETLEQKVAELRAELSSKEERIKHLEEQAESLKEDKAFFKQAFEKEQNNFAELKNLLPGPGQTATAGGRKLTWRERITGKVNPSSKG
jgi:peptidoglycan hydrolase CwlO-like protein